MQVTHPRLLSSLAGILIATILSSCGNSLALPGDPEVATLVAVSGGNQSGTPGSQLSEPLVVEARSSSGQPLGGVSILFSFEDDFNGGALSPGTVVTDRDGRAVAAVTLGLAKGTQTVEARAQQASSGVVSVSFRLIARPNDGGDGHHGGGED